MTNAEAALQYVADGAAVGLGTGHAAEAFLRALADRVRGGLRVRGVPTSRVSETLARSLGIPLVSLDEAYPLDVAVDGADEVSPDLDLIKGWGRALLRERIVAAAAKRFVVLVGPEHVKEKLVDRLGARGKLPVEVVPFALPLVKRRLADLGFPAEPYRDGDSLFLTDNGNHILDARVGPLKDVEAVDWSIRDIPGVVGTGLFLGVADVVLIEDGGKVEVRERKRF
ncbi:MAG TPA: ribose-5-phosphate isomerase RpiA [Gemmataceae bacterium]|jgi:ribose 5-phosphate isomerase A|nr:ribose-5-phosphate isomerase RpiA [Gemmataceae bacterium]